MEEEADFIESSIQGSWWFSSGSGIVKKTKKFEKLENSLAFLMSLRSNRGVLEIR